MGRGNGFPMKQSISFQILLSLFNFLIGNILNINQNNLNDFLNQIRLFDFKSSKAYILALKKTLKQERRMNRNSCAFLIL
jgi:hypothetical protein